MCVCMCVYVNFTFCVFTKDEKLNVPKRYDGDGDGDESATMQVNVLYILKYDGTSLKFCHAQAPPHSMLQLNIECFQSNIFILLVSRK